MAYKRFILSVRPATVAKAATLRPETTSTVAGLATVARLAKKNEVSARVNPPASVGAASAPYSPSVMAVMTAARVHDENRRRAIATVKRQVNLMICWVCGHPETDDRRFVPVLGGAPGIHYWLHRECLSEHRADGEVHNAAMQDGGAPAGSADDPGECP